MWAISLTVMRHAAAGHVSRRRASNRGRSYVSPARRTPPAEPPPTEAAQPEAAWQHELQRVIRDRRSASNAPSRSSSAGRRDATCPSARWARPSGSTELRQRIERGRTQPSWTPRRERARSVVTVGSPLPVIGPRVRDHVQARMIEALLGILGSRGSPARGARVPPVHRRDRRRAAGPRHRAGRRRGEQPAPAARTAAAVGRRDTDALPSARAGHGPNGRAAAVSCLLLLRSTVANRACASLPATYRAPYPAQPGCREALSGTPDGPGRRSSGWT